MSYLLQQHEAQAHREFMAEQHSWYQKEGGLRGTMFKNARLDLYRTIVEDLKWEEEESKSAAAALQGGDAAGGSGTNVTISKSKLYSNFKSTRVFAALLALPLVRFLVHVWLPVKHAVILTNIEHKGSNLCDDEALKGLHK
ncbi:hypothetical protein Fot_57709 [Forsythia ovata]|uniref:Uncharacterized protein n=1 Tax=Forsythia ovata TaxID=205694 RepID=A0ABD1NUC5_9LAMI